MAGITLSAKNHFGTINNCSGLHNWIAIGGSSYDSNSNPQVDIMNNPHIRDKTVLTIGEAIYGGVSSNNTTIRRWNSFGGELPEMLFFAVDSVAIDSVMYDYLKRETIFTQWDPLAGDYLLLSEAQSLGIHDTWNNNDDRQYSLIEYIEIDLDAADLADQTIVEGNSVDMVIEGTDCDGKDANLTYYEVDVAGNGLFDGTAYGLPASLTFSGGEARISWTAQWFDDSDGDFDSNPEIMFRAECGSSTYESDILEITPAG